MLPCACAGRAAEPAVKRDRGDEGAEALAPGHHAALAQAEHRHQVVLAARRHIAPVAAPRAARQAAVVALRSAFAGMPQGAACTEWPSQKVLHSLQAMLHTRDRPRTFFMHHLSRSKITRP